MRGDIDHSAPSPAAPSFAAIAAMPLTTALSINVFLLTTHNGMPNYQLTPVQIDDAAAYIISLRRPQME
jgi:mono/diheme cytochrome c family protein